jgi:hypothetical protein
MKIPNVPDNLQDVLQERMKGQFEPIFDSKGNPVMAKNLARETVSLGFCKKTGKISSEEGFYVHGYREYLEGDEQRKIWEWIDLKTNKNRFDKAEKVKWSDWKGEQFFDGNEFFIELEDFFDGMIEAHGFQYDLWQDYVWATKESPVISKKEAYRVYESDFDDLSEEYDWPIKGVENLQEALDSFVEENSGTTAYHPDYSTAILLGDAIEKFKKDYED